MNKRAAEIVELTFEVTGSSVADIDYSYTIDGKETAEGADAVTLPYALTVDVPRGGTFDFNYFSLFASTGAEESEVACKFTLDGQVLAGVGHRRVQHRDVLGIVVGPLTTDAMQRPGPGTCRSGAFGVDGRTL